MNFSPIYVVYTQMLLNISCAVIIIILFYRRRKFAKHRVSRLKMTRPREAAAVIALMALVDIAAKLIINTANISEWYVAGPLLIDAFVILTVAALLMHSPFGLALFGSTAL